MTTVNPYLVFDGTCEEAFKLYESTFHATDLQMVKFRGSPMEKHAGEAWADKVMHARMKINGQTLMGSDVGGDRFAKPQGFHVSVDAENPAEAERIYNALSEGGKVDMPLQKTFWAVRFGSFTDRFGTPWMVNCEKEG